MTTTLVNIRRKRSQPKVKYDVYCGRGSPYGNPYRIGEDGYRSQVIEKYKKYFYKRLKNTDFKEKILYLKGKVLGCYCYPMKCHCDVIIEYLNNMTI